LLKVCMHPGRSALLRVRTQGVSRLRDLFASAGHRATSLVAEVTRALSPLLLLGCVLPL